MSGRFSTIHDIDDLAGRRQISESLGRFGHELLAFSGTHGGTNERNGTLNEDNLSSANRL